jgi:hypothetical protein
MKIEIIKPFRLLIVGQKLDIDREYCKKLIDKGFAKSLEPVKVEESEEVEVKAKKVK